MPRKSSEEMQLEWKENILKQRQSNLTIVAWCLQNKIAVHNFYYWRDKLFPKPLLDRTTFTEVVQDTQSGCSGISLEYQGIHVHIQKHFEPSALQACLEVLKKC